MRRPFDTFAIERNLREKVSYLEGKLVALEAVVADLTRQNGMKDAALAEAVYLSNLEVQHQKESGGDFETLVVVAKETPCQSSLCPHLAEWIENEWSKR